MSSDFFKISKGVTLTPQASEPTGQNGDVYYNTTLNKFRKFENGIWKNLAGEGSGFKNILSEENSKFEAGVQDWTAYDDGAVSIPVDGTGGSPSAISRSATTVVGEVLEDLTSLKISKSAADGQGEGVAVLSKTIDRADRGKPFFVYFSYDATDANYVKGDLKAYAYDVTNGQLLDVINEDSGDLLQQKGRFSAVTYPQDTCTQIRLIVHCTSTNASAYNVFLDEVVITPQATITGPVMTDWISEPTSIGAITTAPTKGTTTSDKTWWRRVGDSMEVRIEYNQTVAGAAGSGDYLFAVPGGYQVDTSKITAFGGASLGHGVQLTMSNMVGSCQVNSTSGQTGTGGVWVYDASRVRMGVINGGTSSSNVAHQAVGSAGNFALSNATVHIVASFIVPILDWSAGASLTANDAGLQTIIAGATANTGAVSDANIIPFGTELFDNYQAFDTSTGQFTAPRSGYYRLSGIITSATSARAVAAYVGGVLVRRVAFCETDNGDSTLSGVVYASKGQTIDLRPSGGSITIEANTHWYIESVPDFNVFGVQGPVVVQKTTDWVTTGTVTIGATTTAPTKGATAVDKVWWRRVGSNMEVRMEYRQTGAGGNGSGDYLFQIPGGYQIDLTKLTAYNTVEGSGTFDNNNIVGYCLMSLVSSNPNNMGVSVYDSQNVRFFGMNASTGYGVAGSTYGNLGLANVGYQCSFSVPIVGWSSDERLYPTQRVIGTTYLKQQSTSGTGGGGFTSGSWVTRILNTQTGDTGFCSLSSNQFTLQPGTYNIEFTVPAYKTNQHKAKLRNITDSTDELIGTSEYALGNVSGDQTRSKITGRITITSAKTFEIQHRCTTTNGIDGAGVVSTFSVDEIYTEGKIDKIY